MEETLPENVKVGFGRRIVLALLLSTAGCNGCRERPDRTASDASPSDVRAFDVAPPRADLPWVGVIAARAVGPDLSLTPLKDDGILLRTGLYVHGIDGEARITRIGGPADYIPFLREGEDELAGWEPWFERESEVVSGTIARPFLRLQGKPPRTLAWNGSTWTKSQDQPPPEEDYRFQSSIYDDPRIPRPKAVGLPSGYTWTHPHVTKSAVVWIGHERPADASDDTLVSRKKDVTATQPSAGAAGRLIALPEELGDKRLASRSCSFLQSADEGSYIRCSSVDVDEHHVLRYYKLEDQRWTPFELANGKDRELQVVDAEGALWYLQGGNGSPPHVMRIAKDGQTEEIDLPVPPSDLAAPWYSANLDDPPTPVERVWRSAVLVPKRAPVRMGWLHTITPRRSGDVWIVGRDSGDVRTGSTLVRFVRGGSPGSKPLLLPSEGDQRNAILNARGIRSWSGHCNTAFVPFPSHGGDGGSTGFYTEHAKEIDAAIAKMDGGKKKAPIQVALIEGTFEARRVVGAIFLRSEVEARLDVMEAAISRVMAIATTNPASPPTVTCSLPAVENVIVMLHDHNDE